MPVNLRLYTLVSVSFTPSLRLLLDANNGANIANTTYKRFWRNPKNAAMPKTWPKRCQPRHLPCNAS